MRAIMYVSTLAHEVSKARRLSLAFLDYQGVSVQEQSALPSAIAKATNARSIEFCVEVNGIQFSDPMQLIEYFQKKGLCKI